MCSPIGLLVASTGMQIMGQRAQTKAQVAQYNAEAQTAEANKRLSDRKQEQIADRYLQDRQQMNDKMRLVAGRNAAETGASGLMMTGSPLELMGASYDEYNKDIRNWETNKNNDIYGEYLNGVNYQNQANAARSAAANAKSQGNMAMLGTILSGATSFMNLKSQYARSASNTPSTESYSSDIRGGTSSGLAYTNGANPFETSYSRNFRSGEMTAKVPFGQASYSNPIANASRAIIQYQNGQNPFDMSFSRNFKTGSFTATSPIGRKY